MQFELTRSFDFVRTLFILLFQILNHFLGLDVLRFMIEVRHLFFFSWS